MFIWILFSSYAGFLPLYGAIRRLKDWHNAAVISLSKGGNVDISDQTASESDIVDLIPGIHVHDMNSINIPNDVMWRGKISVVDKTVSFFYVSILKPKKSFYIRIQTEYL